MQRDDAAPARGRAADDSSIAPTPLFVGYVSSLALAAAVSFRRGIEASAIADFLLLAASVTAGALALFAVVLVWSARARQRASELERLRPGAVTLRATRADGLERAVRALPADVPFVPLGMTLLTDDTGVEVWCGSAEHPLRLGRAPWEAVLGIRVAHIARWGRATRGIVVTVSDGRGAHIELPFGVLGSGLGVLAVPEHAELERMAESLRARRPTRVEA